MYIAVGIQIINAFLFANILRIKGKVYLFLIACFLSLHPSFLDYYSFSCDHILFTLGDSLALLGIMALKRVENKWLGSLAATFLFTLCIATYQPKIAFISSLLVLFWIQELLEVTHNQSDEITAGKSFLSRYLPPCLSFLFALIIYFSSIFNISLDRTRTKINSPVEIYNQVISSYSEFFSQFTVKVSYLPYILHLLPSLCIFTGCILLFINAWKKRIYYIFEMILLLGILPIALRASYIINSNTWANAGRINVPYVYCILFFICIVLLFSYWKRVSMIMICVFLYFFIIIGTQRTNEAYFKNTYELNKINRIATRIETVVPDLYQKKYGIFVVGNLKFDNKRFVKYPKLHYNHAMVMGETFEVWRQAQYLNFYFGRNIFVRPTDNQRDSILPTLQGRRPWPSPESVFEQNGVVVVLLKKYKPEDQSQTTWTREKFMAH
jgi:hypothetical protein